MKKIVLLVFLIFTGCSVFESIDNSNIIEREKLQYEIESISYSKTFEQVDPYIVKIDEKDDQVRLNIGIGVTEFKNINIEKVEKEGSIVNIYITGEEDKYSEAISYPNIIMSIDSSNFKSSNITYLLNNNNVNVFPIKYSLSQAKNLIETNLNLTTKIMPLVKLTKQNDDFFWNISYKGIIDRQDEELSLVDLNGKLNAMTGEIVESNKEKISEKLDYGKILYFQENDCIYYYKKTGIKYDSEKYITEIYKYLITEDKINKIYETEGKITNFSVNYTGEVAFVEDMNSVRNLFVLDPITNKLYKATFSTIKKIDYIKWLNQNSIYIISKDINDSFLYEYKIDTNEEILIARLNPYVKGILPGNENIIIEDIEGSINSKIYTSKDFNNYEKITIGHNPIIIGNKMLFALYNEAENTDNLYLIGFEEKKAKLIDKNIASVNKVNENLLVYTKNEGEKGDFNVYLYDINTSEKKYLANVVTKDVYYDSISKSIYKNIYFTLNDIGREMIYKLEVK